MENEDGKHVQNEETKQQNTKERTYEVEEKEREGRWKK